MTAENGRVIRAADLADARAIAAVHVASWQAAYRRIVPADVLDALDVPERVARWTRILTTGSGHAFIAERDSVIVGFARAAPSRDDDAPPGAGEITSLYLLEAEWRRGTGSALMHAALEALADDGFAHVTLWVFEANARARAFYDRFGFAPDGARKIHVRSGAPEIRLVRSTD